MTCGKCNKDSLRLRCSDGAWICLDCLLVRIDSNRAFLFVATENFKNYYKNGGNVSRARINMIKSRCMHPDGNGEVVIKSRSGKPTNRRANEY